MNMLFSGKVLVCTSPIACAAVPGNNFHLLTYFRNRSGIEVSESFRKNLLATPPQKVHSKGEVPIGYTNLVRDASDDEICSELPNGHEFEIIGDLLCHLATLTSNQKRFGDGEPLLDDGNFSLFYFKDSDNQVLLSFVRYNANKRKWQFYSCPKDDTLWDSQSRVFSATIR